MSIYMLLEAEVEVAAATIVVLKATLDICIAMEQLWFLGIYWNRVSVYDSLVSYLKIMAGGEVRAICGGTDAELIAMGRMIA
jgi:hypothetical protein